MPRPQRPRRKTVTRYVDASGKRCTPSTPGARKVTEQSRTWFASIGGKDIPLRTEDEAEAWVRLRKLQRKKADTAAGIRTPQQDAASLPLAGHLVGYLDHLRAKGDTAKHVQQTKACIAAVLDGATLTRWSDLDADTVASLLARWRKTPGMGKGGGTMAAKTSNHYAGCMVAFAGWLARKLKAANPLDGLGGVGVAADRRHVRRTLTEEEFGRLLAATEQGKKRRGLSGPDRAMLYITAAYTGLRASALAALTPAVIHLGESPPSLTLTAATDKSRRGKVFPLHPDVAARLRSWLQPRPDAPLWPGKWASHHKAARMLRADLDAAGIVYRDERGRVADFHSLRSSYATGLVRAGVPLAAAQKLLGHSSPTITAKHYVCLETDDLAKEVAKLPPLPPKSLGQP